MKDNTRTRARKWIGMPVLCLAIIVIFLHGVNIVRLGAANFEKSASRLIDRSRRIRELAGPHYQNDALARLKPNPNNGTFYHLSDLVAMAVVGDRPKGSTNADESGLIFGLEFQNEGKPGLRPALGKSVMTLNGGTAAISQRNPDYLVNEMPIDVPMRDIGEVVIRARTDRSTRMIIALRDKVEDKLHPSLEDEAWRMQIWADLIGDGAFHTYAINVKNLMKRSLETAKRIKTIMIRPSMTDGAEIEIDYIRFISVAARYLRGVRGSDYENVGKEMRKVLYMLVPQTLEYSLRVPEESAFLSFGAGILVDDEPVKFEASIAADRGTSIVYGEELLKSTEWHDRRINLSPWAGQNVRVRLQVSGSQKNVAFWSDPIVASKPKRHFNVIMVLEDALRADHLSMNGYSLPTSPVKDALLAKSGIVFVNAISQACWTRSSVPSIMTSLLPTATGVWHFSDYLQDEFLTLAELMRAQGFLTASFIQNENAGAFNGVHQGFSQILDESILGGRTEGILGDRLKQWLEGHRDSNFLLYLHVRDPHGPYNPPAPFDHWYKKAEGRGRPVRRKSLDPAYVTKPTDEGRRGLYDGEIAHNDSLVPTLLDKLDALGIKQDTLLVFLSDHGEHLGEHGLWGHGEPGYIQTIHPSLNLVYPARFRRATRIVQTVQLIDVMPTILELAEIDTQGLALQGDSLLDLIEGRSTAYWNNRMAASEEPYQMSDTSKEPRLCGSLFFRDWHLINSKSLFKGSWYLPAFLRLEAFNFHEDRDESQPLSTLIPDFYIKYRFARIVKELQTNDIEAWKKWTRERGEAIHKADPDAREHLKALGYVK